MSWYDDEWVAIKEVCAQIECEEVFTLPQNPNNNEVATNGNNTHKTLNAWRIHFVVMQMLYTSLQMLIIWTCLQHKKTFKMLMETNSHQQE